MPRVGDLLDRESQTVDLAPGDFERLLDRRERKQRNQRRAAGALAAVVMLATAAMLLRSFTTPVPADPPAPAFPGPLAYFAYGDLWVADWDGSNEVLLVDGAPATETCGEEYTSAGSIWSPDGRYLAARRDICQGSFSEIVIFDTDGEVVGSFTSGRWLSSWSPDSTRIAAWTTSGAIGIFGLDGELEQEAPLLEDLMPQGDFDLVWSPDGAQIMASRGVVVPLDGTAPYRLPPGDPRSQESAAPSPDGSHVAYLDDEGKLVVADADGSRTGFGFTGQELVWSPTGDQIAVASSDGPGDPTEVLVVDVLTGEVTTPIGMGGSGSFWPVEYSPDGDRILIRRTDDHDMLEPALWIMNADGTGARRLATAAAGDWQPVP